MRRLSLSLKIFLGTAAVVTGVLGATLAVTSFSARRSADRAIDRGLRETNARIAYQLQARQAGLTGQLAIWAENRDVVGVILHDAVGAGALDQAQQLSNRIGARWVQFTDSVGVRLAKSDEPAAQRIDLSGSRLVGAALEGKPDAGFGVAGDTAVIQVMTVPLLQAVDRGASARGVIMAASDIGDSLAREMGEATGSEIAFYAVDSKGVPHVSGATIPSEARSVLLREIAARLMREPGAVAPAKSTPAATRAAAPLMGAATARTTLDIAGTSYIGQGTPLLDVGGQPVGGFIALRSLDAELAGYHALRRSLLITGALGLLLAFGLSLLIARQIVRPVTALVAATERAAEGDYAAEIPAAGGDEIGTLANAFRRLLADLRDKQALVDFLGGGQQMTTPISMGGDPNITMPLPGATMAAGGLLRPGQLLAQRFDIKAVIGAGGMGMVYRAVDRELGEVLAIKTLKPEIIQSDPSALERFKSEIRLARKISHRNVVRTHDLGEASGLYFITMEFVEGTSLKELVRQRGRLPVNVLLPIAKQLCRALEMAHDAGVIHRDIKPQNMVVEGDGTLKVMDFGIARLATRAPSQGLTQVGMVVGTPEYMAPEQLLGDELDVRADVYSAGVVLYECLTGHLPFSAPTAFALISRVLEETPVLPHVEFPDIPAAVGEVVMHAMAREPSERPATALALHDLLERLD
ncbi:MAG: protein kinase [Gemmatimonadaceae bacterium]|nr:protein kinase [Gemmatimonadaceae bacterium]